MRGTNVDGTPRVLRDHRNGQEVPIANIADADYGRLLMREWQCSDVRIFAVSPDGTETPLPTYEEALELLEQARAETCTPMALTDVPSFMRDALTESVEIGRENSAASEALTALGVPEGGSLAERVKALGNMARHPTWYTEMMAPVEEKP